MLGDSPLSSAAVSTNQPDVVIIGAGIVGAACALECAESGLHCALVEPHVVGGGATAAGMGHIVVMDTILKLSFNSPITPNRCGTS